MLRQIQICLVNLFVCAQLLTLSSASAQPENRDRGDLLLDQFFQEETARITENSLADIQTLKDWQERQDKYRKQLQQMLGLFPLPKKTELHAVTTRVQSRDGIIVENLHFQSLPGLYVTGNLYRPEQQSEPLPAILYVCGHGRVKKDGISYGNKTHYQHHGAWFAKNGYVCLTIDTIQLGEIEGLHHGTYREGMWWWHNRGYTPAGVEAWNGIRSLDYLQSRPEVDEDRIGMTGRSGGGAYTWWTAALDERVKVSVPVAGITSMHNHIVDGCIEGHCDCMYMVNLFQWDFPQLAALVAPRPLLISNTDKDRIFPLDGVVDVYFKSRRIYELYDALDHIGLNIAEGPHQDTQELRVNAFHWMNRFLKEDDPLIETTATKLFSPEELKVFDQLPTDERVTTIHDSFVPERDLAISDSQVDWNKARDRIVSRLKKLSFRNWPGTKQIGPPKLETIDQRSREGVRIRTAQFQSDSIYSLPVILVDRLEPVPCTKVVVTVCSEELWTEIIGQPEQHVRHADLSEGVAYVFIAPRGIGPTNWTADERKQVQIRRRFSLLGHTLDSLRIFDVLRGIEAIRHAPDFVEATIALRDHSSSLLGFYVALLVSEQTIESLDILAADFFSEKSAPNLHSSSQCASFQSTALLAIANCNSVTVTLRTNDVVDSWKKLEQAARDVKLDAQRFSIVEPAEN